MVRGRADRVVPGRPRLHDDAAPERAPPRPARHLRQQLESALGGAEVRQVQRGIRVHYADHRHVGEVQSLRDHLCPEQDVHVPPAHAFQNAVMRPLAAGRVQIHARQARRREPQLEKVLELLGADAAHPLRVVPAGVTGGGDRLLVAAIVGTRGRRRSGDTGGRWRSRGG